MQFLNSFGQHAMFLWIILIRKRIENTWNNDFLPQKSLILINFVNKNRLAAGTQPGVTLGGEHASGGPLRGG